MNYLASAVALALTCLSTTVVDHSVDSEIAAQDSTGTVSDVGGNGGEVLAQAPGEAHDVAIVRRPVAATTRQPRHRAPESPCDLGTGIGFATPIDIIGYDTAEIESYMADVAATGATWVRVPALWNVVEPSADHFDFEPVDRLVDAARHHGLKTVVMLGGSPQWIADSLGSHDSPPAENSGTESWARYVTAIAHHLGARVNAWEVCDAANQDAHAGGRPARERYADYLRTAYPILKESAPHAPVVGISAPHQAQRDDAVAWTQYFYDTGAHEYFDALSFHPYMSSESFTSGSTDPEGGYLTVAGEEIRRIMVDNEDGHKQIWVTEVGYPTGESAPFTEEQAADFLRAQLRDLGDRPFIGPLLVFGLNDQPHPGSNGNYGMRRADGSEKPALGVVREASGRP